MAEPNKWSDFHTETVIGNLLRAGVLIATAVMVVGCVLYLIRHGSEASNHEFFKGEPSQLREVSGILQGVKEGSGRAVIQLGVILLVATPVSRVAFSIYAFARQRDTMYVVITMIVLGLLVFSLTWGSR